MAYRRDAKDFRSLILQAKAIFMLEAGVCLEQGILEAVRPWLGDPLLVNRRGRQLESTG